MTRILSSVPVAAALLLIFLATSSLATAQSRPQEVLDLAAAHQALAMKIRPLQDRIIIARVPPKESQSSGARVSERLRHKDRAATATDEYGRLKVRFSALDKKARAERERVMRPNFGVGLRGVAAAKKKLAALQREADALEREVAMLERAKAKDRVIRKKPGRTK